MNKSEREKGFEDLPELYSPYRSSIQTSAGTRFALVRKGEGEKRLLVQGEVPDGLEGGEKVGSSLLYPLTWTNAQALMEVFEWLRPIEAKLEPAFGCGDRIGLATPGHLRALEGTDVVPVLAQQSIREMERTGRGPQDVMNTAVWGVFQEGYRDGFVADADHLMSREAVRKTARAGFTMYTCDPSEHVNDEADELPPAKLREEFDRLEGGENLREKYVGRTFQARLPSFDYDFEGSFSEEDLLRAAVKYYPAVRFAVRMFSWVKEEYGEEFDYEVSVDETENPTSPLEHIFVARELKQAGVELTSLAPRFIGNIQKGIDYIGDLEDFENSFKDHAAIARELGPYKLSLHSGSDKFSIYPPIGKYSRGLFHVKTAGTSYLEAVRVIAKRNPELLRRIYEFALDRFEEDRATYHVETDLEKVPAPEELKEMKGEELARLLDEDDSRQVFHITYGSVLSWKGEEGSFEFRDDFKETLRKNESLHYEFLKNHIGHHLELLMGGG